jgi:hypothetical protein
MYNSQDLFESESMPWKSPTVFIDFSEVQYDNLSVQYQQGHQDIIVKLFYEEADLNHVNVLEHQEILNSYLNFWGDWGASMTRYYGRTDNNFDGRLYVYENQYSTTFDVDTRPFNSYVPIGDWSNTPYSGTTTGVTNWQFNTHLKMNNSCAFGSPINNLGCYTGNTASGATAGCGCDDCTQQSCGFVVGPPSSTDGTLAVFNSITGRRIKEGAARLDANGQLQVLSVSGQSIYSDVYYSGGTELSQIIYNIASQFSGGTASGNYLPTSGGTMSGEINLGQNNLIGANLIFNNDTSSVVDLSSNALLLKGFDPDTTNRSELILDPNNGLQLSQYNSGGTFGILSYNGTDGISIGNITGGGASISTLNSDNQLTYFIPNKQSNDTFAMLSDIIAPSAQTISLTGDVSGSGTTVIPTTVVWSGGYATYDLRYANLNTFNNYTGTVASNQALVQNQLGTKASLSGASFNSLSGTSIFSGSTNLNTYFTANASAIASNQAQLATKANLSGATFTGAISAVTLSASTIYSGSTDLSSIFATIAAADSMPIQNGINTFTAGTSNAPSVNISSATLNNLNTSGTSLNIRLSASTLSSNTINVLDFDGVTQKSALASNLATAQLNVGNGFSRLNFPNNLYMFDGSVTYKQTIATGSNTMTFGGGWSILNISPVSTFTTNIGFNTSTQSSVTVGGNMAASSSSFGIGSGYAWIGSVNQTAGHTGIAAGLFINPTVTSVSSGGTLAGVYSNINTFSAGTTYNILASGTAQNYLAGLTTIPSLSASSISSTTVNILDGTTQKLALDSSATNTLRIGNGFTSITTPAVQFNFTANNPAISSTAANTSLFLKFAGGTSTTNGVTIVPNGNINGNNNTVSLLTLGAFNYIPGVAGTGSLKALNITAGLILAGASNQTATMIDVNPAVNTLTSGSTLYGVRSRINIDPSGATTYNIYADGTAPNLFAGTITSKGFSDGSIAPVGVVGETVQSILSSYTNYTTTATYQSATTVSLTAGDWLIKATGTFNANTATITAAANAIFNLSTTSASAAGTIEGLNIVYIPQAALLGTSKESVSIEFAASFSSTTQYYLNTQATFTLGNPQFVGSIVATRKR